MFTEFRELGEFREQAALPHHEDARVRQPRKLVRCAGNGREVRQGRLWFRV